MDKRLLPDTFIRLYKSVVSNSKVWDGEPIIVGTWQTVDGINGWMRVHKSAEVVATHLGITTSQVKDAVRYYKKIRKPIRNKRVFEEFKDVNKII